MMTKKRENSYVNDEDRRDGPVEQNDVSESNTCSFSDGKSIIVREADNRPKTIEQTPKQV